MKSLQQTALWLAACALAFSYTLTYPQELDSKPTPETKTPEITDRKLAPLDIILIEVFGEKDLTVERKVEKGGTISYPFLTTVKVAGKTPSELAEFLKEELGRDYLVDPQVTVQVKEYVKRFVSVIGEVNRPGLIELPPEQKWTVLDAISKAEGLTKVAKHGGIELTRDGKTTKCRLEDLKKENNPAKKVYLQPDDVIEVKERFL